MTAFDEFPRRVTATLHRYFDARAEEVARIGEPVNLAVQHLRDFVLNGGKRVRPTYAWAGFLGAKGLDGAEDPEAVLSALSSLEFIQACALIHDDIIDASDTRRGQPTIHRRMEAHHRDHGWHGEAGHFGESVAILVGDMALAWAEDMFLDSGLSPDALRRAREPWRAMRTEVIGGQVLDIVSEASGTEDIAAAEAVNRFKTAAYTIERPLHLGAALAGGSPELIAALRGYGRDIGIAYQLRDDQLGVFGDPSVTGKPAGDDVRNGKRTVLLATALQAADAHDPAAAEELRQGVGHTRDEAHVHRLTEIIRDMGAEDAVENSIAELQESGLRHLTEAGIDPELTENLRMLALRATERRS